ncbi:MAG: transporter substrate-binding protein [Acidimicrobiales bacterium]|nr:transporter substrate-binding protein [Acidimicrobiales bacterium]
MTQSYDRRAFLSRGGLTVAGVGLAATAGGTFLSACGSSDNNSAGTSDTTGAGGSTDLGTLDYQLSWIKNVEFAGAYIADTNGYYTKAGFSKVNLMAGGPQVAQDAVVQSGKAFIGISSPDITAAAINKGADLIIIGAQYQKNPFAVMSLASKPIATPEDMYGKKIGVQATNEAVWNGFIKASGLDASKITKVPVQFDPQGLVNGEVDGWFSFVTNEPNLLKTQGVDTVTFLLNDHGYPYVSETMMVKASDIKKNPEKIKGALIGDIKGWNEAVAKPEVGANLAATKYGKDQKLDEAEQVLESKAQNKLVSTKDTDANGLFTITDALIADTIKSLAAGGVKISADKLFDMSLLEAVYKDDPSLKG